MADYISREAAIKTINELLASPYAKNSAELFSCGVSDALRLVRDILLGKCPESWRIPAADVRPVVHGGWKPNPRNPYWLDCTVCGYGKPARAVFNFCPNCGADMREAQTDG